jgi:hypothetical protein
MDYKDALGIIAIIIGVIGYIPYFRTIITGATKPHAFSWLVWGVLTATAFGGQLVGRGQAGSWVTGFTALICFSIFTLSLVKGRRDFPLADWLCLIGCVIALGLWAITKDPFLAIILITLIDMLAFIPTFRKSYLNPYSETAFTYFMSALKFLVSLFALHVLSSVTVLYPASLVLTNGAFVILLIAQRKRVPPKSV